MLGPRRVPDRDARGQRVPAERPQSPQRDRFEHQRQRQGGSLVGAERDRRRVQRVRKHRLETSRKGGCCPCRCVDFVYICVTDASG